LNNENTVEIENVSLTYRQSHLRINSLKNTIVERASRRIAYEEVQALNNISFEIKSGEILSIIGANGAGKSSLLKLMARVLPPSSGNVRIRGEVAPMIELGAGFSPELTAAENIILYGALLGRDVNFMRSRIGAIADSAQVGRHIDIPIRSFSSGMLARLAFSIATDQQPSLLLIDEVLSVGDKDFQNKSKSKILDLARNGCSVVLVTHDFSIVKEISHRTMLLDKGLIKSLGEPSRIIENYISKKS